MPDNISFTLKGNVQKAYDAALSEVQAKGGDLTGDANSGSFSVPVPFSGPAKGTYTVSGQAVNLCLTHKPWYVSPETIRAEGQEWLDKLYK